MGYRFSLSLLSVLIVSNEPKAKKLIVVNRVYDNYQADICNVRFVAFGRQRKAVVSLKVHLSVVHLITRKRVKYGVGHGVVHDEKQRAADRCLLCTASNISFEVMHLFFDTQLALSSFTRTTDGAIVAS